MSILSTFLRHPIRLYHRIMPYLLERGLILLLIITSLIWAFAKLAGEMIEGDTNAFDTALLMALRNPLDASDPIGPAWIEEMGRDFTALGGVGLLTLLTLAASGYLFLKGARRSMWLMLIAVGGGVAVSTLFKESFERSRPDLVPHGSVVYTASFPSGHSMMAAVTYLTLGVLLARVEPRPAIRIYIMIVAVALTLGVGVSRVYLGVHWPTDVLAGWAAGAAWALLCWMIAHWLELRGRIEPEMKNSS